jgi:site-specific recombinase XerC
VVKRGKTPVLEAKEARALLDSIPGDSIGGLRDRALIGVMIYSFAQVGAVCGMNVEDYYQIGKRAWFRLHEKGDKHHEVPTHHKAEEFGDAYLDTAGLTGKDNKTPPCPHLPYIPRHRYHRISRQWWPARACP